MNYEKLPQYIPTRKYSTNTNSSEKPKKYLKSLKKKKKDNLELLIKKQKEELKLKENNDLNQTANFFEMDLEEEKLIEKFLKLLSQKNKENSLTKKKKKKKKKKL